MRSCPSFLLNTADIEIWPAALLRARSNRDARVLARAEHVLRRKRDGGYVVATLANGWMPLMPQWQREAGLGDALDALDMRAAVRHASSDVVNTLPAHGLQARLEGLDLDADAYAARTGLALVEESAWLAFAGLDRYRRPLWLHAGAARAWRHLHDAATRGGVALDAISGYRSHAYQLGIFARKRASGLQVDDILQVNAAPGFSEHHSGMALDLSAPGEPPAETSFEATPAFNWLTAHAADHGFAMSYPRGNPHGIVYEPWHWRWSPGDAPAY